MALPEYPSFQALQAHHAERRDNLRRWYRQPTAKTVVIAPHGGRIEPGTELIAKAIARSDFSYYTFMSRVPKTTANLHVTSHRFDDPRCVALISQHDYVLAVHGCRTVGTRVFVGGRDKELAGKVCTALRDEGLRASIVGHQYPGLHPMNICNRGARGRGVQLELTKALRGSRHQRTALVRAVRRVLLSNEA